MNLKILTVYQTPSSLPEDKNYLPIFVGNSIANKISKDGLLSEKEHEAFIRNTLTDDAGSDNISRLNRSLNEMTGIYWAWKNYDKLGTPDVIGLSHYRRFFIFNESLPLPNKVWLPNSSCYIFNDFSSASPYIDTAFAYDYFKEGYDCIAPKKYDARLLCPESITKIKSCEERFYQIAKFDPTIYQKMEKLVLQVDESYSYEIEKLRESPSHHVFNMFLMKKELFFDYCEFIFPILLKLNTQLPITTDATINRAPGYLSEFLTSIFISHSIRCRGIKLKELNTCFLKFSKSQEELNLKINKEFSTKDFFSLSFYVFICIFTAGKIYKSSRIEILKRKLKYSMQSGETKATWTSLMYKIFIKSNNISKKLSSLFSLE